MAALKKLLGGYLIVVAVFVASWFVVNPFFAVPGVCGRGELPDGCCLGGGVGIQRPTGGTARRESLDRMSAAGT